MILDTVLLPLAFVLAALLLGVVAHRAARARNKDGETGWHWQVALQAVCLGLGILVVVSAMLESLAPGYWATGHHLSLDLSLGLGMSIRSHFMLALGIALGAWALCLVVGLIWGGACRSRWIAGVLRPDGSRRWVLVLCLPLVVLIMAATGDLGAGPGIGYPAVTWALMVLVVLALVGVAQGRRAEQAPIRRSSAEASPSGSLPPWPESMRRRGIEVTPLMDIEPTQLGVARARDSLVRAELDRRLERLGASGVATQMVDAMARLLELGAGPPGSGGHGPVQLVTAPDECGQLEVVACGASALAQRFQLATLIVVPRDPATLQTRLRPLLPDQAWLTTPGLGGTITLEEALVWLVDAETLSERLLPHFRDGSDITRIGLVVWWDLHEYTGVLAANLWAISRRLHRLMRGSEAHGARTLALTRHAPSGDDQADAFLRDLLPVTLDELSITHIGLEVRRKVHVHLLGSHQELFSRSQGSEITARARHPELVAAKVSVDLGWPTGLEGSRRATSSERASVLQLPAGERQLEEWLITQPCDSGVWLRELGPADVLSLRWAVSQCGRSLPPDTPRHVGCIPPRDPYATWVLSRLGASDPSPHFRRLVCAHGNPGIVRRHLLAALAERPDTRESLLKDFRWEEQTMRETLDELCDEARLRSREVRALADDGQLVHDQLYESWRAANRVPHPIDTVGTELVEVIEPSAAHRDRGVRMRVDPERLCIQAYPYRVFNVGGERFQVDHWESVDKVRKDRRVGCTAQDNTITSWRMRLPSIQAASARKAWSEGWEGKGRVRRTVIDTVYQERVLGALHMVDDLTTGEAIRRTERLARPILQQIPTRALILQLPGPPSEAETSSLAQALRHALPVHVGVEEDALEVLGLDRFRLGDAEVTGLAVVDLFPGGIGLAEALNDSSLVFNVLRLVREWLEACPCSSAMGCERCLASPGAAAAGRYQSIERDAALTLLERLV